MSRVEIFGGSKILFDVSRGSFNKVGKNYELKLGWIYYEDEDSGQFVKAQVSEGTQIAEFVLLDPNDKEDKLILEMIELTKAKSAKNPSLKLSDLSSDLMVPFQELSAFE